jgi:seryl-tRNA synthetase
MKLTTKTPTPETDDLARGNHVVPTEWAEQLERERDEAIRQRNETNESSKYAVQHAERERDSLQAMTQSLAETCVKLKAERDEARAELTRHGWRLTS